MERSGTEECALGRAMMMKRKGWVLGAFVATAMAATTGCGSDEKPAATEATTAAPATTVAAITTAPATTAATTTSTVATTTSSTRPTATVQQVASVLAREIPDWKSAVEGIGDCRLEILIGRCDVAQGISYITAATIAGTIKTVLFAVDYPKAKSYIGDIPQELKALVTETMTKAEAVQRAGGQFDSENCAAGVQGGAKAGEIACGSKLPLDQAIRDFDDVLQGWTPYL